MWIKTDRKSYINARYIQKLKPSYHVNSYTVSAIMNGQETILCECDSREECDNVIMLILANMSDKGFIDATEMVEVSKKLKRGECVRVE